MRAARQDEDQEALYQQWWQHYDQTPAEEPARTYSHFWKLEEKQGRFKRPRLDLFFHHYLQYQTEQDIHLGHLFQAFRHWWDEPAAPRQVEAELREFRRHSDVFRALLVPDEESRVGLCARRLKTLDTSTVYPILLLLLVGKRQQIHDDALHTILTDIESYLVRRMVCNLTTKNYNLFFRTLLRVLRSADQVTPAMVRAHLMQAEGDSVRWPNDAEFERAFLAQPVYRFLKSPRTALVLEAIDLQLLTDRQEDVHLRTKLTVEHVMPEEWHPHWSRPSEQQSPLGDESLEDRRDRLIHTFGNLTLLTQKLNSSVSNGPFLEKGKAIAQQSVLRLNAYFQGRSTWDEERILERGQVLCDLARRIWPHPGTMAATTPPSSPSGTRHGGRDPITVPRLVGLEEPPHPVEATAPGRRQQASFHSGGGRTGRETFGEAHALAAYYGEPGAAVAVHYAIAACLPDAGYPLKSYPCTYAPHYGGYPERQWPADRAASQVEPSSSSPSDNKL